MGGFVEVQASAASSQASEQSVTVSGLVSHCIKAAVQASRKLLMGGFVEAQASATSSQDTVQSVTVSVTFC